MKYKKISVVLPGPLSGACRLGKEECRQEAGRNQAGVRKQAGGRQGLQWLVNPCLVSRNWELGTTADKCVGHRQ